MKFLFLLTAFCCFTFFSFAFYDDNTVASKLTAVKLYRSGAEMTHTASVNLSAGYTELYIDNVSNAIDINSVQVKVPAFVTIQGISFQNNYLKPAPETDFVHMLKDSAEHVQDGILKLNQQISSNTEMLEVLRNNRDMKGEQTGLSVSELQKLMDYYQTKLQELQNNIAVAVDKKNKLAKVAERLQQQIDEENKKNVITAGRLLLQLSAAMPGKADFTISYLATNASWTPFYDIRVENTKSPAKFFYKAKIIQTTGIDWKQVKLSLSSSVPSQKKNAPVLQSWFLGYIDPNTFYLNNNSLSNSLSGRVAGLNIQNNSLDEVVVVGYSSSGNSDNAPVYKTPDPVYIVNGSIMSEADFRTINPNSIKKMEKLKPNAAASIYGDAAAGGATVVELKDGLEDYVTVANNELNINFDIDMPYDVPTNGKERTAVLQTTDAETIYQHYAVPKLDEDAYLLAQLPRWEKLNLLPGEANIILEGTWVGKTIINPNATTDTLKLTLGADKRVIIKREKMQDFSSTKFLGSNKIEKFTYQLTIKNNKSEPVNILVKDQFPLTTNKDIEVELLESTGADINKDLGVLNWNISLAPNESKQLRFSYSIKYPKDKMINVR